MSPYEIGTLALQALTLAILFWTLMVIRKYTRETERLAQAAVEDMPRPCIQVLQAPDSSDEAIIAGHGASIARFETIRFKNIGTGPALNFRYEIQTSSPTPYFVQGPALSAGEVFDSNSLPNVLSDPARIVAEYESLGGARYRSETVIESRRWIKGSRFENNPKRCSR